MSPILLSTNAVSDSNPLVAARFISSDLMDILVAPANDGNDGCWKWEGAWEGRGRNKGKEKLNSGQRIQFPESDSEMSGVEEQE